VEQWLIDQVRDSGMATEQGISCECLNVFNNKDEEIKLRINYLITLGGDGTILYAAKQFPGDYIPLIVSFALVKKYQILSFRALWGTCATSNSRSMKRP
jgi:NAD kinase